MEAEKRNPGLILKFGFNHRYHNGIMEAKKVVESRRYGKILWMRGIYGKAEGSGNPNDWRLDPSLSGGGILLDQGIHMLFLDIFAENSLRSRACVQPHIGIFRWRITLLYCCEISKAT
jgi:predicted dehydrogenase